MQHQFKHSRAMVNNGAVESNHSSGVIQMREPDRGTASSTNMYMVNGGSYVSELYGYIQKQKQSQHPPDACYLEELFHKQMTASDVGKLNRLVVPKRQASKHFNPEVKEEVINGRKKMMPVPKFMVFYDRSNIEWQFYLSYWKSNQSYVFTKGWKDFVKAKRLRSNDTVTFYSCECCKVAHHYEHPNRSAFVIDVEYGSGFQDVKMEIDVDNYNINGGFGGGGAQLLDVKIERDLLQTMERKEYRAPSLEDLEDDDVVFLYETKPVRRDLVQRRVPPLLHPYEVVVEERVGVMQNRRSIGCSTSKGFRLFGVQIN